MIFEKKSEIGLKKGLTALLSLLQWVLSVRQGGVSPGAGCTGAGYAGAGYAGAGYAGAGYAGAGGAAKVLSLIRMGRNH